MYYRRVWDQGDVSGVGFRWRGRPREEREICYRVWAGGNSGRVAVVARPGR